MYKKLYQAGFVAYVGMFILAIVFFKERMINMDASLYLFNIVRTGNFSIEHMRFIAVVTEVFPVLATKLSLPLNMIMISYSAGFIIYYSICYLLCGVVFKNYKLGLALLLYHILFTSYTFYWSLSEFIQSISLMFPALAYIHNRGIKDLKLVPAIILILVIITLAFAHPLMMFPLSFALLFFSTEKLSKQQETLLKAIGLIFIVVLIIKTLWIKEAYDSKSTHGLANFLWLFPDYFNTYSNKTFLANCIDKYYWIPVCFVVISTNYIIQKAWLKLLLFSSYVIGYLMLMNISYPTIATPAFYIENLYLPMGVFIAIPLVFDVFKNVQNSRITILFFSLIMLTAFVRIYLIHPVYTARLDWERDFLDKHPDQKMMIDAKKLDTEKLMLYWSACYEFWLLSTTEYGKTASIIIHEDPDKIKWTLGHNNAFITNWGVFKYADLNKQYFILKDTGTFYTIIE